jgi:pyrrolidone-carboxylate peptidase
VRLLIYGFGPYRNFKKNITERILKSFPLRKRVKRVVFPVRFDRSQFLRALRRYRPDAVLGLGQCSRGRQLRIERRAVNRRREQSGHKLRPIGSRSSRWLSTTLKLEKGGQARFSTHAGDYVCNYSMYVILDYLKRKRLPARFGFIHIPHDYSITKAKRFLAETTKRIDP